MSASMRDVRYNVIAYLQANTDYIYTIDNFVDDSPQDCIAVRNDISTDDNNQVTTNKITFVARAATRLSSQAMVLDIYKLFVNQYYLTLPETTVGATYYSEILIPQILSAIGVQFMRIDNNQLFLYHLALDFLVP